MFDWLIEIALLGGFAWAVLKMVQCGYVEKMGVIQRGALWLLGTSVIAFVAGQLNLFGKDGGTIVGALGVLADLVALPWILEPLTRTDEKQHRKRLDNWNRMMQSQDAEVVNARNEIFWRAHTGQYESPEQRQADFECLARLLGNDPEYAASAFREFDKQRGVKQLAN